MLVIHRQKDKKHSIIDEFNNKILKIDADRKENEA